LSVIRIMSRRLRASAAAVLLLAVSPATGQAVDSGSNSTGSASDSTLASAILAQQNTTSNDVAVKTFTQQFGPMAFALSITNCCDPANQTSVVPYIPAAFATPTGNSVLSPVLGYRIPYDIDDGAPTRGKILQYGINITGIGSSQSSWFFAQRGSLREDGSGGLVERGSFFGTRRGAANQTIGFASGQFSSPAGDGQ
jgi:hypothetical protein